MKQYIRIFTLFILCFAGMHNEAWAAKITYHILALPMDHTKGTANTTAAYDGWRTEAIKVEVASASTIQLEAHFKSPLAKNFTYYPASVVTKDATARQIYQYRNNNKYFLYKAPLAPYVKVTVSGSAITKEEVSDADTWGAADSDHKKTATSYANMESQVAAPLADGTYYFSFQDVCLTEGDLIPSNDYHVYITYEYDVDNTIAKLDGSEDYNILIGGSFLAYNRGRNNRVALVPPANLSATKDELISEDFVYVDVSNVGTLKDKTYWSSTDNKNPAAETKSKFHFLFNYIGEDPYNITIRSAYDKNLYYIEKYGSEADFVKKWYEGSSLFAKTTDEMIIGSDENRKYTQTDWNNPSSEVTYDASDTYKGYYHGILQKEIIWNSFAILNAVNGSGDIVADKVVFLGTRTTKSDGNLNIPSSTNFYYLGSNNPATVKYNSYTRSGAPTADKNMYEVRTYNFKVKTPFGNTVTESIKLSEYTIGKDIDVGDIPEALKRKYCSFNGKFYKNPECTEEDEITKYTDLTEEPYDIYVGYTVDMPFNSLKPADSYTTATWYELTDEGSIQENGKKIKYDTSSSNYKNNGANGEYVKESEFAFVGNPYELKVLYRKGTEDAGSNNYVTLSTYDTWEIPDDNTNGSFLLRKFDGTGHWYWNANHLSESFSYSTKAHAYSVTNGNAQTLTFTISNLTYVNGHYIKVTKGGTNPEQVVSTNPTLSTGKGAVLSDGTATVTVNLAANTSGDKTFTITIQEYNGSTDDAIGAPTVITITQAAAAYAGNTVTYSTDYSTRIMILEMPTRDYTYNIVDKAGNIAAKATVNQTIFSPLSVASIPSIIVSPFIMDETITFYTTYGGTGRGSLSSSITQLPLGDPENSTDIYVKYTTSSLESKPAKLNETQEFNVKLNGLFLYYDAETGTIKTNDNPTNDELKSKDYLWKLRNRDPYSMLIDNFGAREVLPTPAEKVAGQSETVTVYDDNGGATLESRQKGAWVKLAAALGNDVGLTFDTNRNNAQRFIAKASTATGIYEVMVATNTVDASTTYYNIGCLEANTVKIYSNTTYVHGDDELKFILNQNIDFTYHLIDRAKHELLTVESRNPELALPAEYQSPLVGTYNYYSLDQMDIDTSKDPDEYKPKNAGTKLNNITDLYATYNDPVSSDADAWNAAGSPYKQEAIDDYDMLDKIRSYTATGDYIFKINNGESYKSVTVTRGYRGNHIYVTYEKNNIVTFGTNSPYMLKFLQPYAGGYYLEDGNDELTTSKIQAVYPYCNGDGSLNIYGTAMNEEQMNGGSSTRPRWIWYFTCPDEDDPDPYHVRIRSRSTISYNSVSHPTYLQTFAIHFNQDTGADAGKERIVTGGVLAGIASVDPTEYMVLGIAGAYKLLTTKEISADEDGDGEITSGETKRRSVTSFEQYWKTYNMIKKCVLDIDVKDDPNYKDAYSSDESTWVVPEDLRDDLEDALEVKGVGAGQWHSYDAIANAVRWNGYNDKGKANTKLVEKLEHWYQTFDMGDGTFDIESADIPPVLVLLDRHGWEIMRKPLGYNSSAALDVLRTYDSPMVKEYKFYSNATKATGCHKYVLRMQNGAERDQIKVNGVHYTSTSLADLPPETASGVKSNGAFNDQFVTYTVKEEYENSYQYHLELHEEDDTYEEWGTPSKFLVLQHGRFARNNADVSKPNYLSKPIRQGSAVPSDNGEVYDMILEPTTTYADPNGDGKIDDVNLWYVGPNLNIDEEMGIKWSKVKGETLEPHTEYETKKEYKDKTGFDPYNIQLQHVKNIDGTDDGRYMTSHMTSANRINGVLVGNYTGTDYYGDDGSTMITLKDEFDSYDPSTYKNSEGYDHTNLQISNQTFMAVSDANGNMQLMPRFDHTKRINVDDKAPYLTTLEEPSDYSVASVDNWRSQGPQTTFLVRPQVFEYHIIDNEGNESLRYKTCGEYTPSIVEHFRSPLASDFKYYFGYAATTTSVSSKESRDAAATSGYFKKEAASVAAMETAAKALTVVDDYYFKVNTGNYKYVKVTVTTANDGKNDAVYTTESSDAKAYEDSGSSLTATDDAALETAAKALTSTEDFYYKVNTYNFKKITVTKAHSGSADATYTATDCTETEWTNAVAYQQESTDDTDFITDAKALANKGLHYFRIGPTTLYRKVTVDGTTKTAEESNSSDWSSHSGATVADMSAYKTAVAALSSDGTYYYEITAYYSYKKVVVTNTNNSFSTEVHDHEDISNREITGTFAEVGLNDLTNQVYVRYSYDPSSDDDEILQGKWLTIKLANKDVQAYGTIDPADGTGVSLYTGEKPGTIDGAETARKWQWKFLAAPVDPSSEYFGTLDPYAIRIFNRNANYTTDLSLNPNPMGVGIKVNDKDRFALLSHPDGGYAMAVAKEYDKYDYYFLNGASMTVPSTTAATTYPENRQKLTVADAEAYATAKAALTADGEYYYKYSNGGEPETFTYKKVIVTSGTPDEGTTITSSEWEAGDTYSFTYRTNALSPGTQLLVNDDVTYNYTYNVITNDNSGNKLAASATQDKDGAAEHNFTPYLPFEIQSPLLNADEDYIYYGSAAISDGTYTVVPATKLVTLYGLYNDELYVRYEAYDIDKATYEVPNKKTRVDGKVAKDPESKDAALYIDGSLPYDIIWENDNMMRSNDDSNTDTDGTYIKGKDNQNLQADATNGYVWKFQGGDPYALKIYNNKQGKYIHAASADNDAACTLTEDPTTFMLLKRDGYDYGVLEITSHKGSALTMTDDNGTTLGVAKITTSAPKYFIIFGLSTHKLIYHLLIAKTCPDHDNPKSGEYIDIPYRPGTEVSPGVLTTKRVYGTTQRNLSDTYQLGSTIFGKSYSYDAGEVSIGDLLKVPEVFDRPNTVYFYYVDNIQTGGDVTFQKEASDASDYATKKAALAESSDGYYYFKIGTSTYTYKRVQVKDGSVLNDVDCVDDDWSNAWQDNATLNDNYKGLEITRLMSEPGLIGGLVQINVGYAFQTGLETNAGEGFVTSLDQNLWYTYETKHDDGTPYLAHYTNAWGLQAMEGRETRYTNDYLWTPLGDVYGFKMYNRYMIKNSNGAENVMTMPTISEGTNLKMAIPGQGGIPEGNEVFELLASNTLGYFRVHPVINNEGTQYYVRKDPADNYAKISTNYSEWTFNLNPELLQPYIERKGYVGGLKKDAYDAHKTELDKVMNGTATYADMLEVQGIVYDDDNIVKYEPGYYRLHSQPGVSDIAPVRYASGYLHKTELTGDGYNTTSAISMHFYSKVGTSTTFNGLESGYTKSHATQGEIPVPATEYDPSTIFYFSGTETFEGNPRSTIQTQGLYVAADANGDAASGTTTNKLQRAVMTSDPSDENLITFSLMDIGGAVLLIHDGSVPATRRYLNFDQSNTFQKTADDDTDMENKAKKFTSIGTYYFKIGESSSFTYKKLTVTAGYVASPVETNATYDAAAISSVEEWNKAADIYDLKYYHDSPTDDAKWCMQPADDLGLMVKTNNGGDDFYYSTFYAPYDVKLPADVAADPAKGIEAANYYAYICTEWNEEVLHPKKVGQFNTGTHADDDKFIPAGTPVIIRTSDNSESVKLSFPSNEPSSSLSTCIFSGEYLEQLLTLDASHDVYTMGLPFTSNVEKDEEDYSTTGKINAELPEKAKSGIGFYINATENKEADESHSLWTRNNRYVLHNKIYYRAPGGGGGSAKARKMSSMPQFVPVIFDDELEDEELQDEEQGQPQMQEYGDGVYDLSGRKVANEEQVQDGTWRQRLSPGIYIVQGKKIKI